ncbi:MAG: hypothetical protein RL662_295 [Bacteroidota bacterium]|jgi:hypothetical protein
MRVIFLLGIDLPNAHPIHPTLPLYRSFDNEHGL